MFYYQRYVSKIVVGFLLFINNSIIIIINNNSLQLFLFEIVS